MKKLINEQDIADMIGDRYGLTAKVPSILHLAAFVAQLPVMADDDTNIFDKYMADYEGSERAKVIVNVSLSDADKIVKMFGTKCLDIMDVERTGVYENIYEVASDTVCLAFAGDSIARALDIVKEYTRSEHSTLEVKLVDTYPKKAGEEAEDNIKWNVVNGIAFGGGKYELPINDEQQLLARVYWLHFLEADMKTLSKEGVEVVFKD